MGDVDFLIGEQDFIPTMLGEGKVWRDQYVKDGDIASFDGVALHYYMAVPEQPKGAIVMVHGFCEFWGKYHEMAWYFWKLGYSIFFLEQRGHGLSEGKVKEFDVVHIGNYKTYVRDLHEFMEQLVLPNSEGLPLVMYAHSMGGAIGAYFLETYPEYFGAAVLSSPMLKMKADKYPAIVPYLIGIYGKLSGKEKRIAPGQNHFDGIPIFEKSSTLSKPRYDYLFDQRLENKDYQTYGASLGWGVASMKVSRKIKKEAHQIKIPLTIFAAGKDHLVDPQGFEDFKQLVPQTNIRWYPTSKHEIFNADEEVRYKYYQELFQILEEYFRDLTE